MTKETQPNLVPLFSSNITKHVHKAEMPCVFGDSKAINIILYASSRLPCVSRILVQVSSSAEINSHV